MCSYNKYSLMRIEITKALYTDLSKQAGLVADVKLILFLVEKVFGPDRDGPVPCVWERQILVDYF